MLNCKRTTIKKKELLSVLNFVTLRYGILTIGTWDSFFPSSCFSGQNGMSRACLKNHSCNLHVPICGIFCLHSVDVARYAALIQAKSPTNCNAHLTESIFQTRSAQRNKIKQITILFSLEDRLQFSSISSAKAASMSPAN